MTVEKLVDEGSQFMLTYPTANRHQVCRYLINLGDQRLSDGQIRDGVTASGYYGGASG